MDKWRILGVDNGTSLLGLALLEYSFTTNIATVLDMRVLAPGNLAYERFGRQVIRKGNNAARRLWMKERFGEYLDETCPQVVGFETPFIGGPATLSSFEPLALSLDALIDELLDHEDRFDRYVDYERVAPHQAKQAVSPPGIKYDNSKEMVKVNVLRHPQIDLNGFNPDDYDQDATDAIAIGWTVITRLAKF